MNAANRDLSTAVQLDQQPSAGEDLVREVLAHLPEFDMTHIQRLSYQTGILQHATYTTPNYQHGYCLDDNSRGLLFALMAYERQPSTRLKQLIETYFAFIYYMQLPSGKFRNFLSFDLQFLDNEGSEDSYGRTIWALGNLLRNKVHPELEPLGKQLFMQALPHANDLISCRAVAYTLLGLITYVSHHPEESSLREQIHNLAYYLADEYRQCARPSWPWYEKVISYDNAMLPLAVLRAGRLLDDLYLKDVGRTSFAFLDSLLFEQDHLSTIGNAGWFEEGKQRSRFGQQPIEVSSTILLYHEMYEMEADISYFDKMCRAFLWFFGHNDLRLSLYDAQSKGCRDGLDSHGVNQNQGAESTLCFWIAYLDICRIIDLLPAGLEHRALPMATGQS